MKATLKLNSRTSQILKVMYILTWVTFIGLLVSTGAVLVSYIVSYANPVAAGNLYMGLDLGTLRAYDFWQYTQSVSFIIAFGAMKAYILFLLIKLLSKVNMAKPFTPQLTKILERISFILLGIGVLSILKNEQASRLVEKAGIYQDEWATQEFIFIAGLVFIISQLFKRGGEIQSENELTV